MKRIHFIPVVTLILIALIFAYSQAPQRSPQTGPTATVAQTFTIARQAGTQQRINRYFHGAVVPRLKNCWSKVQGKGTITLKYTYAKAGASWRFSGLETAQSTLPGGQASVAEKCMSDAIRGTSFPADAAETNQNTFVLNWTWPVPFPAIDRQLITAMFAARPTGETGGGCDGAGTAAKCYNCKRSPGPPPQPYECITVCVGYSECTTKNSPTEGTGCTASGSCASGGPFGVVGGSRFIY